MQTLSTIGRFVSDAACAILYTFSIAISLGIVTAAYTHHLLPMTLATVAGLIITGALCPHHRTVALATRKSPKPAAGGRPPSWGKP